MPHLSHSLKSSLYWFVQDVSKGLLENDAWDFDFDLHVPDWTQYQATILEPTIFATAFSIWMNNIELDESGNVLNEEHAALRAFQCLRPHFDPTFSHKDVQPPFADWELLEAQ